MKRNRILTIQEFIKCGETEANLVVTTKKNGKLRCAHHGPVRNIVMKKTQKNWQLSWSDDDGDPTVGYNSPFSGEKIKMEDMRDWHADEFTYTVEIKQKGKRMKVLKPTDLIRKGYYGYHVHAGKIDDVMSFLSGCGDYEGKPCQQLVDDGWDFVCSFKKYKKGDNTKHNIWPKSMLTEVEKPKGKVCKIDVPCFKCERMGKTCWPCLPFVVAEGCDHELRMPI